MALSPSVTKVASKSFLVHPNTSVHLCELSSFPTHRLEVRDANLGTVAAFFFSQLIDFPLFIVPAPVELGPEELALAAPSAGNVDIDEIDARLAALQAYLQAAQSQAE